MVSVPYAFKAHEADTLGGRSVSDFVLAAGASSTPGGGSPARPRPAAGTNSSSNGSVGNDMPAPSDGPTNFSGSTTGPDCRGHAESTGAGLVASAPSLGIKGTATDPNATAYGVQGVAIGTAGVGLIGTATSPNGFTYGLRGTSSSISGTGVRGIATATSGNTTGVSGYVDSSSGTAGVFNNAAGGNILAGQNNGAAKFTVNGSGNVSAAGGFTGSGAGLTGITFSQLTGQLASSQLAGTYSGAVTLSNTGNSFSGNGANLINVPVGSGSNFYIQNRDNASQNANFDISGNGVLNGQLTAYNGVYGQSPGTGNPTVFGVATATSGLAYGVEGYISSTAGAGVYGVSTAASGSSYGVYGSSNYAPGVYGQNLNGIGVQGFTTVGTGVVGTSTATSGTTYGVLGTSQSGGGAGVAGKTRQLPAMPTAFLALAPALVGVGVFGAATCTSTAPPMA